MMMLFDRVGAESLISKFACLCPRYFLGRRFLQPSRKTQREVLSLVQAAVLVKFHFLLAGRMRTGEEEEVQFEV